MLEREAEQSNGCKGWNIKRTTVIVDWIKTDPFPLYSQTQYEILIYWPGLWNWLSPYPQRQKQMEDFWSITIRKVLLRSPHSIPPSPAPQHPNEALCPNAGQCGLQWVPRKQLLALNCMGVLLALLPWTPACWENPFLSILHSYLLWIHPIVFHPVCQIINDCKKNWRRFERFFSLFNIRRSNNYPYCPASEG